MIARARLTTALFAFGFVACGAPASRGPATPLRPSGILAWSYEILPTEGSRELLVEANLAPGLAPELGVDNAAQGYVRDLQIFEGDGWTSIPGTTQPWLVPGCRPGCRLRYKFALEAAARAIGDPDVADAGPGFFGAPPSTFLLHPLHVSPGVYYRFHVETRTGADFLSGVTSVEGEAERAYSGEVTTLAGSPYSAFGDIRVRELKDPAITLGIAAGKLKLSDGELDTWVMLNARAIAAYYGRIAVRKLAILVKPTTGGDVVNGRTNGGGAGATIVLSVGERATMETLQRDWMLPHEMVHTSLPNIGRRHHWLEEGLAVYVEPFARARARLLSPEDAWQSFVDGLPKGLPTPADAGLDGTTSWGRTYWGGALFCMLADLEIRRTTSNAKSLDDALRAVVAAGGSLGTDWPIERVLDTGDSATGTKVLTSLYAQMKDKPLTPDLESIWKQLGVVRQGSKVAFDDSAPLSAIRKSMTAGK